MSLEQLILRMKERNILQSDLLEKAFMEVDRRDYVPPSVLSSCYEDRPLPIGEGQTISQPSTVAFMLELLQAETGNRVLDVGSGSGWTTALLAWLVGEEGHVVGLERISFLAEFGKNNLAKKKWMNAEIYHANGNEGWPDEAPYDRILVSAAAGEVPEALVSQLNDGGRLVIPLRDARGNMLLMWKNREGTIGKEYYPGFAFVPFVVTDERKK